MLDLRAGSALVSLLCAAAACAPARGAEPAPPTRRIVVQEVGDDAGPRPEPAARAEPPRGATAVACGGAPSRRVPRAEIDALFENPESASRMARLIPWRDQDGELGGIQLGGVRPETQVASWGLQNGDVVLDINGRPLASAEATIAALVAVRGASEVRVNLRRGGKPLTLCLDVVAP